MPGTVETVPPQAKSPHTSLGVLLEAGRILARSWPLLLVIYLLGAGFREASITLAVLASAVNGLLGNLVLALAPLAMLSAIILMLRATLPPEVEEPEPDPAGDATERATAQQRRTARRWRRVMGARARLQSRAAVVGASLVPFLAVYQSQGFLREDQFRFWNEASYAEFMWGDAWLGGEYDADRIFITSSPLAGLALLAVAFGLRQLMGRRGLAQRSTVWSFVAAYLEITWVIAVVGLLTEALGTLRGWVDSRVVIVGIDSTWERVVAATGPVGTFVAEAWSWVWALVGNLGIVVVIPLAWLTVGAVVLGRTLPRTTVAEPRLIGRLPRWMRPVATRLWNDLRSRFGRMVDGLRMLSRAGLVPMLAACLALLVVDRLRPLAVLGLRELLGPVRPDTVPVLAVYLEIASYAIFFLLMVCLVSAATARLAAAAAERTAAAAAAETEAEAATVAAPEAAVEEDEEADVEVTVVRPRSVPGDLGVARHAAAPPEPDRLG